VLASFAASVGAANSADLAVKAPVYKAPPPVILSDWAGFYIGVNGGYGSGSSSFPALIGPSPGSPLDVLGTVGLKPKGGLGGGQIGYNWQFGSVVVGLEGDFDGADIKGTNNNFDPVPSLKTDELASVRGRLGYALLPNVLVYGTGGYGYAHSVVNVFNDGNRDINQDGYAAGGGLEYKFLNHWIARAEYLHYGFGNVAVSGTKVKEDIDVFRGGISYKF